MAAYYELRSTLCCVFTEYLWSAQQGFLWLNNSIISHALGPVRTSCLPSLITWLWSSWCAAAEDCCMIITTPIPTPHSISLPGKRANGLKFVTVCPEAYGRRAPFTPPTLDVTLFACIDFVNRERQGFGGQSCFAPLDPTLHLSLDKQWPCLKRTINLLCIGSAGGGKL
jgi:hypothetical protein